MTAFTSLRFVCLVCYFLLAIDPFTGASDRLFTFVACAATPDACTATPARPFAPVAIARHGDNILVLGALSKSLVCINAANGLIEKELKFAETPGGLTVDGNTAYVTAGTGRGLLYTVDLLTWKTSATHPLGHSPTNPLVYGNILYACNRFANTILAFDLQKEKITSVLPAIREPVALVRPPGESTLWVCNLLPHGRANGDFIAAAVSIYETDGSRTDLCLPNGTHSIRGIAASPDGKWTAVTHLLSRYALPATQVDKGWMNTNAFTLFSVNDKKILATILLDDIDLGAPNPWAIAFSPDGTRLYITHAGAPEMSVIDFPALMEKIAATPAEALTRQLGFLGELRQREPLAVSGARALWVDNTDIIVAGYFSDDLSRRSDAGMHRIFSTLGDGLPNASPQRRGEAHFNDAQLCFQNWQSCVSCHPDARMDALNWDLPNDGIGNPKNTRSMLFSHATPPAMTLGVRADAETAVRKGFIHIQFVTPSEEMMLDVDVFLKSLTPVSSPFRDGGKLSVPKLAQPSCLHCHDPALKRGKLTKKAKAGRAVFTKAGCAACHPHPYFTDMQLRDAGTLEGIDAGKKTDTPSLLELWRTAPYLHDGRAATIEEAVFKRNPDDRRGHIDRLSDNEKSALLEYLRSL